MVDKRYYDDPYELLDGFEARQLEKMKAAGGFRLRSLISAMHMQHPDRHYATAYLYERLMEAQDGAAEPVIGVCGQCGIAYVVVGPQVYCSTECATDARKQARRVGRSKHLCERCGAAFTPRRADARYCSTRCRVAAHRARG
jgi:hypothetical protein